MAFDHTELQVHTTGNFLAKQEQFADSSIAEVFDLADKYHNGEDVDLGAENIAAIAIHGYMLHDDEQGALSTFSSLRPKFEQSDVNQVKAATDSRNLDYFLNDGIAYAFNEEKRDEIIASTNKDLPLTAQLIRGRIATVSGFEDSRLLYLFHDVLDHAWLFDFMREQGLTEKYEDVVSGIGSPFEGFLFSRQSEIFSGIGFASRRYLSNPEYFNNQALPEGSVAAHLRQVGDPDDKRIADVVKLLDERPDIERWASFALKDTTGQIAEERRRWGAVKILQKDAKGNLAATDEVLSLYDPRYIALVAETVARLAEPENTANYVNSQQQLNLSVETSLRRFIYGSESLGKVSLAGGLEVDAMDKQHNDWLMDNPAISTNYFIPAHRD